MGNWKEQMAQANQLRQTADILHAKELEEKRSKNQETKMREEERSKRWEDQRRDISRSFKLEKLLGEVRDDVWGVGAIEAEDRGGLGVVLSFAYDVPLYVVREVHYGGDSRTEYSSTGKTKKERTSLEVDVCGGSFYWIEGQKWEYKEGIYLQVRDSEVKLGPVLGADKYANSYGVLGAEDRWSGAAPLNRPRMDQIPEAIDIQNENARVILDEVLLRSCVIRSQGNLLPLQLKTKADMKIAAIARGKKS